MKMKILGCLGNEHTLYAKLGNNKSFSRMGTQRIHKRGIEGPYFVAVAALVHFFISGHVLYSLSILI